MCVYMYEMTCLFHAYTHEIPYFIFISTRANILFLFSLLNTLLTCPYFKRRTKLDDQWRCVIKKLVLYIAVSYELSACEVFRDS